MADEGNTTGGGSGGIITILGLFIALFIVWVATGGPQKEIASGGFLLSSPRPISTGETLRTGADLDYTAPSIRDRLSLRSRGTVDPRTAQERTTNLEGVSFRGEESPYAGLVEFKGHTGREKAADSEYLILELTERTTRDIEITDWTLVSMVTGTSMTIPEGAELPRLGRSNSENDIDLVPGDRAYIISGRSPIEASFRHNICIGYFEQFYDDFEPSLPNNCPLPKDELKNFGELAQRNDDACQVFARTVESCSVVTTLPEETSEECGEFFEEHINYNGCIDNHRRDDDFYKNEWYIYLEERRDIWEDDGDVIRLLDHRGRIVDQISY